MQLAESPSPFPAGTFSRQRLEMRKRVTKPPKCDKLVNVPEDIGATAILSNCAQKPTSGFRSNVTPHNNNAGSPIFTGTTAVVCFVRGNPRYCGGRSLISM